MTLSPLPLILDFAQDTVLFVHTPGMMAQIFNYLWNQEFGNCNMTDPIMAVYIIKSFRQRSLSRGLT